MNLYGKLLLVALPLVVILEGVFFRLLDFLDPPEEGGTS